MSGLAENERRAKELSDEMRTMTSDIVKAAAEIGVHISLNPKTLEFMQMHLMPDVAPQQLNNMLFSIDKHYEELIKHCKDNELLIHLGNVLMSVFKGIKAYQEQGIGRLA